MGCRYTFTAAEDVLRGKMLSHRGGMTMQPNDSKKGPYVMEMQPGKYFWCSCRRTAKPPYCDGAHNKL